MNNLGSISLDGWPHPGGIVGPFRTMSEAMAEASRQLEIVTAKRDREAEIILALRVDAKVSETRAGREL